MNTSQIDFPKGLGLGYLWDKEVGWSELWIKMIGGEKKVKQLVFCVVYLN